METGRQLETGIVLVLRLINFSVPPRPPSDDEEKILNTDSLRTIRRTWYVPTQTVFDI
jgi:hypothetical protein